MTVFLELRERDRSTASLIKQSHRTYQRELKGTSKLLFDVLDLLLNKDLIYEDLNCFISSLLKNLIVGK